MLADQIANHVNYFNNGAFVGSLFDWADMGWPSPNPPPNESFEIASHLRYVTFKLYRLDEGSVMREKWDDVVIEEVTFGAKAALPFQLSALVETPDSAMAKLSTDTYAADTRVSYFMPDGLVACLYFKPAMAGLQQVILARLGVVEDWQRSG